MHRMLAFFVRLELCVALLILGAAVVLQGQDRQQPPAGAPPAQPAPAPAKSDGEIDALKEQLAKLQEQIEKLSK